MPATRVRSAIAAPRLIESRSHSGQQAPDYLADRQRGVAVFAERPGPATVLSFLWHDPTEGCPMIRSVSRRRWFSNITAGMTGLLASERLVRGAQAPTSTSGAMVDRRSAIKITRIEII